MPDPVRLAASLDGPAGAPVLVLGNSLGTSRAVWDRQLPALRQHFRLLRYEHRGHGDDDGHDDLAGARSPAPPGPYTIAGLAGDVAALLDAHQIERASYCGISLGGMIGMWLAAHLPDRITSLALCCTSAYLPPASAWTGRAAQVRAGGLAPIAAQVAGRWVTPAFRASNGAAVRALTASLSQTGAEGYAGCCEAIAAMDLRPVLGAVTAPTLVIAGEQDPATPPWHGAVIAAAIPGARLQVIRGAAHLANVSSPGEVTGALLRHLVLLQA